MPPTWAVTSFPKPMAGNANQFPDSSGSGVASAFFPRQCFEHPLPNRYSEHERCIPFATQGLECEGKDSPASLAQVVRMHKGEMSTWLDTALYSPVLQFFLLGFPIALPVQLPLPPLQALSHGSKILTHQVMRDFWPQAPLCVFNCIKRCLTKDLQKKARRQPKG